MRPSNAKRSPFFIFNDFKSIFLLVFVTYFPDLCDFGTTKVDPLNSSMFISGIPQSKKEGKSEDEGILSSICKSSFSFPLDLAAY